MHNLESVLAIMNDEIAFLLSRISSLPNPLYQGFYIR